MEILPIFFAYSVNLFFKSFFSLFAISDSFTLATYNIGLDVNKFNSLTISFSSSFAIYVFALLPSLQCSSKELINENLILLFLSPDFASFSAFIYCFSSVCRSAKSSSVSMISASAIGSTFPDTCEIFSLLKQRIT